MNLCCFGSSLNSAGLCCALCNFGLFKSVGKTIWGLSAWQWAIWAQKVGIKVVKSGRCIAATAAVPCNAHKASP